jgi:hypothetical protein
MLQHVVPRYNLRQRLASKPAQLSEKSATSAASSTTAPAGASSRPNGNGAYVYEAVLPSFPFAWLHRRASTRAWPWVHVVCNAGEDPYDAASVVCEQQQQQQQAEEEERRAVVPVPGDELTPTQTLVQGVAAAFAQLLYVGKSEAECHLYRTWFPTAQMWTSITPQTVQDLTAAATSPDAETTPRILVVSRSAAHEWARLDAALVLAFLKQLTHEQDTLVLIEADDIEQLPAEVRQQAPVSLLACGAFADLAWQWQAEVKSIYAETVPDELFTDARYRKGWVVAARGKGEPRLFDVARLMSLEERRTHASKVHRYLRPPSTTFSSHRARSLASSPPTTVLSRLLPPLCFCAMASFYFCLLTYAGASSSF